MTISHRATRSRTRSRSCSFPAETGGTDSSHNHVDDAPGVAYEPNEVQLRGSSELPPVIPNVQNRPLLTNSGKTQWIQDPPPGEGRTPSSVLSILLKKCHPGLVEFKGKTVVASTWKHYQAAKDNHGKSVADVVQERFWLRFKYDPGKESEIKEHIGRCCDQLLGSIIYYGRINATVDHFRTVKQRVISDKIAGKFYLTKSEYEDQRPVWCKEECWSVLATQWSDPEFQRRSEVNRANRYSGKFKPHKGGSSSIAAIRQRLAKERGREVSEVEAWVYTHRGPNLEDPNSLNTEEATTCLERYKAKALELNGPDFNWLNSSVDVRALYECSCGRRHGKWSIFNGIIDDTEAIAEVKNKHASSAAAKRRRQEEGERIRKEAHESRSAKEYAHNMAEWARMAQMYNENVQKFMENVAVHTGMPVSAVPPPLPPPPMPPTCVSMSQNGSHGNVGTFGSCVGVETPEEVLSRIAYGQFGGVNASRSVGCNGGTVNATSDGANFSPHQEDDFPLFGMDE